MFPMNMNRREAAFEIRGHLGDRLVHHTEWGSRFPYSSRPASTPFRTVQQQVGHYHGGSAQLPRIRRNAKTYGDKRAEIIQVRTVDRIHYVSNGWAHGVAYCLLGGALTGLIYEARSAWYPHGAHFGDRNKDDFPLYQMLGLKDTAMTEAQVDVHFTVAEMLVELFGMRRREQTDHGNVPGNSTSCAGRNLYRPFIRLDAQGLARPGTYPPSATPADDEEGDPIMSLPVLVQTWFKPGDPGDDDYVRLWQSTLNLLGYIPMEGGVNYDKESGKFDGTNGPSTTGATKDFQRATGLMVDGKVGNYTWARAFSELG